MVSTPCVTGLGLVLFLCSGLLPRDAGAQLSTFPTGTRLRVTAPTLVPGPVVGPLLARIDDTLRIGHMGEAARIAIPLAGVTRLERTGGHRRLVWAVGGASFGATGGAVLLGAVLYAQDQPGSGSLLVPVGIVVGAGLGAMIGAPVGALLAPEKWIRVHLPPADSLAARSAVPGVAIVSGTRLRVTPVAGRRFRASGALRGDSLAVVRDGSVRVYPLGDIAAIEVMGGRDRRRGAALWGGALASIAIVGGGIDYARDEIGGGELLGGVLSNALIGAAIGALLPPRGWKPVPLPRSR